MTKLIFTLYLLMMIYSCNESSTERAHQSYDKLKQTEWILGQWEHLSNESVSYESWNRFNDSSFHGSSYFIEAGDTLSKESISLEQHANTLTYNPSVSNQNSGETVVFTLSFFSDHQVIFENKEHDFPQIISYTKINDDSIYAEISGKFKGEEKVIPFPFKRIKLNS